jgi:hypothetical protein
MQTQRLPQLTFDTSSLHPCVVAMPAPVEMHKCTGSKSGCFFSQKVFDQSYNYACKRCHVRAPHLCASPAFKQLCIKCFYDHPNCPYGVCMRQGCREELVARNENFEGGNVELSSSAESPPMALPKAASLTVPAAAKPPSVTRAASSTVAAAATSPSVTGAASSTVPAAATSPSVTSAEDFVGLQMMLALSEEVETLREQLRVLQDRVWYLERHREYRAQSWRGEWPGEWNDWYDR